ncbi:hypothetical protein M9Y10_017942 [Tritrichomonas musculus]|uniref:Surface antigen BspA-like n=1 Tax=Tritrichomonas musculus TaxID=1915356 RepID=A0ABR2HV19_9EUKA
MKRESSNKRKEEILDLLKNHNHLKSEEEIYEIFDFLLFAFKEGALDLIKILLCETIEDDSKGLTFKIDKINKTASLIEIDRKLDDVIIPRTINHELNEFLVTSICILKYHDDDFGSQNKTIKFEEDSAVRTIYRSPFLCSRVEEIYFPESLIELKEGWCDGAKFLKKIIISPSNGQFVFKDDKYLLGKSDSKSDVFDILLFARRDIEDISIPSNVKIIKPFSFQFSVLKEILIPSSVTKICENAFSFCRSLKKVSIPTNSNLKTIEREAFNGADIEEIYFPEGLIELEEGWCYRTYKLAKIIISPSNGQFVFKDDKCLLGKSDSKSDEFDILLFARRDIEDISIPSNVKVIKPFSFQFSVLKEIFIPSSVTKICENAFSFCRSLKKVSIPTNSNLKTIEKYSFSHLNIEEISIPASVTEICKRAFQDCKCLRKVDIPTNSNLQTIERYAFSGTGIKGIFIPASVTKICENAFSNCADLSQVSIPNDSNLQIIEECVFEETMIEEISIPASVTKICSNAFSNCENFVKIEIPTNSNLKTIEREAFNGADIEEIYFPEGLIELEEGWCDGLYNLKNIIISPLNGQFVFKEDKYLLGKSDSNSDEFDILLFARRDIEEISIPANVTKICHNAFGDCENLRRVEIPKNSNLKIIERDAFRETKIEEIFIPASVTKICYSAFLGCSNLRKVELPTNSNLQTIESRVFGETKIEEISIPASVTKIGENAFCRCKNLAKIEIPTNSNLKVIENEAFSGSNIEEISFPEGLIELEEEWCNDIHSLAKIIISPSNGQFVFKDDKYLLGKSDSKSDEFDILLFARRDIKDISIPSNVKIIKPFSFQFSVLKEIFIPSSVTKICENAFSCCRSLKKVSIPTNSNLKTIGKKSFSYLNIEEISIPASVTEICEDAFQGCKYLIKVEIPVNSNLQTIERYAFSGTGIKGIILPASVTKICSHAFDFCYGLITEISEESRLHFVSYFSFGEFTRTMILIPPSLKQLLHIFKKLGVGIYP